MYQASDKRYSSMQYNRCGKSGLMLPAVSLGLWHNFGDTASYENMKQLCFTAFDNGITHFDLANNYGPAPGSAEKNFGSILKDGLDRSSAASDVYKRQMPVCPTTTEPLLKKPARFWTVCTAPLSSIRIVTPFSTALSNKMA